MDTKEKKDKYTIMLKSDSGDEVVGTSESSYAEAFNMATGGEPMKFEILDEDTQEHQEAEKVLGDTEKPQKFDESWDFVDAMITRANSLSDEYKLMEERGYIRIIESCKVTTGDQIKQHNAPIWVKKEHFKTKKTFVDYVQESEETYNQEIEELGLSEDFKKGDRKFGFFFARMSFLHRDLYEEFKLIDIRDIPNKDWKKVREALGIDLEEIRSEEKGRKYSAWEDGKKQGEYRKYKTPIQTPSYLTSLELTEQITLPRPRQTTIFDFIKEEENENNEKAKSKLISRTNIGLPLSAMQDKVIKAMLMEYNFISRAYGQNLEEGGIPKEELPEELENNGHYIVIEPKKFTRKVLGLKENDSIPGDATKAVLNTLKELEGSYWYSINKRGEHSFRTLFSIDMITPKRGNKPYQLYIDCKKIMRIEGAKNFTRRRSDELELLSGITDNATIILYNILSDHISRDTPTYKNSGYILLNTEDLLNRVGMNLSYDKNPKLLRTDLSKAIRKLKGIGIIIRYEVSGNNHKFYLPKDWLNKAGV